MPILNSPAAAVSFLHGFWWSSWDLNTREAMSFLHDFTAEPMAWHPSYTRAAAMSFLHLRFDCSEDIASRMCE